MGISFLTPLLLAGLAALSVPIILHLIRHHRGEPLAFPSLMFLRELPIRAVRRRRIRDWPLLLLRLAALALIVLAFARPVLQGEAGDEGADGEAFREVVITLDRSWTMRMGDRWERALEGIDGVLSGLVSPDRVSLVIFDGTARVVVEPTLAPAEVRAVLDTLRPGWGPARIGAGVQAAGAILDGSDRSRREVFLAGDMQRRAWDESPGEGLPEGASLEVLDVGGDGAGLAAVSEMSFQYQFVDGRQRVHPRARILTLGELPAREGRVILRIDGREAESRPIEFPDDGAVAVEFEPFFVSLEGLTGSVEVVVPGWTSPLEPWRFALSPDEVRRVILVDSPAPTGDETVFLRSALSLVGGAPIRVERRGGTALTAADLEGTHLVVLNDVPLPRGTSGALLRERIEAGTGLIVIAGPRSDPASWEAAWDAVLPGRPGAPVEGTSTRGATLAGIDGDHPVFSAFSGPGRAGLGVPRFFRYRSLGEPAAPAAPPAEGAAIASGERSPGLLGAVRIPARFTDGTPALAERRVGEGRILIWTSSMDSNWSDLPLNPAFVPLVQEMVRHAAPSSGLAPSYLVGQPLDPAFLRRRAGILDEGEDAPAALLVPPDGTGVTIAGGGARLPPDLGTPGYYRIRPEAAGSAAGWSFAVNVDMREADPTRIDTEELAAAVGAVTRGPTSAGGDQGAELAGPSLEERERRQSHWLLLLLGAVVLLAVEPLFANRSRGLAERTGGVEG
jgi:hypothetical protein